MASVDTQAELLKFEQSIADDPTADINQFTSTMLGSLMYESWRCIREKHQRNQLKKEVRTRIGSVLALINGAAKQESLIQETMQTLATETRREVQLRVIKLYPEFQELTGNAEAQQEYIDTDLLRFSDRFLNSTSESFFLDVEKAAQAAGLDIEDIRIRMSEFNRCYESRNLQDIERRDELMTILTKDVCIPITRQLVLMGYKVGETQF